MPEEKRYILWVDDEIELLRSHVLYLNQRGYEVAEASNGADALELAKSHTFDLVLIDEMMPTMNGLELLRRLKELRPELPMVMVTKNEAEELMEQAIGSQIAGFLTKPVNPSQILSVLKGILDRRQISETQLSQRWTEEFARLSRTLDEELDAAGWLDLHARLSAWELELDRWGSPDLSEMLHEVRLEADRKFGKWIETVYQGWIASPDRPPLSMDVVDKWLLPLLASAERQGDASDSPQKGRGQPKSVAPVLFLVIDCMRYDQWLTLEPLLAEQFEIHREAYFSILPTATPYSRNALFSGLTPVELDRVQSDLWNKGDEDEGSSNRYERQFLTALLERRGIKLQPEPRYVKVLEIEEAADFEKRINEHLRIPLTSMVYNFVDILLHTRQSLAVLREMIPDESAFRSVIRAWFEHSSLFRILQAYGKAGGRVLVTSDHGSRRGRRGTQVFADRETTTSLRYKLGRNLKVEPKHSVKIKDPAAWGLPQRGINTEYVLAKEDFYFVYPTNYHHYLELYRDSFQHGGISLEEMALPVVTLIGKG